MLYRIKNFFFHLKRTLRFIKIIWKDQDWDYDYLLEIEYNKLKWMREYFNKSKISQNNPLRASEINMAIKMIDIIRGENSSFDYIESVKFDEDGKFKQVKYINTRNASRFIKSNILLDRITECSDFGAIIRDNLRIEKAWYLYNEIRKNMMRNWWD